MSAILLISPEPWEGHFVSKHHYALELARRGHQVLFYGPPDTSPGIRLEPVADAQGRLQVLRAPKVAPGLRFLPGPLRRSLEARWLARVEKALGRPVDVIWLFENSRFYDMRFAGPRLKIYQQVDLNQDFHPAQAANSADIAIALNVPVRKRLLALGVDKPVHLVSHGLFVAKGDAGTTSAPDLPKDRINAAYIGNLGIKYLDVDAFSEVVRQHCARVVFHLFGKFDETMPLRQALAGQENVVWHGWQAPETVYRYLEAMDITMVLYRTQMDMEQISNSHKILEYLHSGAVVASSFLLDYKDKDGLIEMAPLGGRYADLFASVVARIDSLNSPERRQMRRAHALKHTYPGKLDQIEAIVVAHCPGAPLTVRPLKQEAT
ncbi:hypothetical protein [Parvibaculum sp.]|uniref:hypothetical protein n=1 Tax=Parvibaculum sp. TaxID=2024848 RepID=UPI00272D235A|nr:hypothetical protein [Parvibaculum sp.]